MFLLDCFGLEKIVPPLYESPVGLLHHAGTGTFIRKGKGGVRKRRGERRRERDKGGRREEEGGEGIQIRSFWRSKLESKPAPVGVRQR